MSTPFTENFDKVALTGPAASNLAPGAAIEAQNIGRSQQRMIGVPQQISDAKVSFPPLYGANPVLEVQQALYSAQGRPSALLDGVFQAGDRVRQAQLGQLLADASVCKVNDLSVVVTTDPVKDLAAQADKPATANFLIRKDGSIQFDPGSINADAKDHKLVIAVEADGNHVTERSPEQQASLDSLTTYLIHSYMTENGKIAGTINDNGLISDTVKKALGATSPEDALPDQMRQEVHNLQQLNSANTYVAPQEVGNYVPSSRYQHGDNNEKATENAWAGLASGNNNYTGLHNVLGADRGFGVGRYAITYDMFVRWFMGLDPVMGFNIDELAKKDKDRAEYDRLVAQLAKDHKLTKEQSREFASPEFKSFMAKLQAGGKLTPEMESSFRADIEKYLPAKLQEQIGRDIKQGFEKELQEKYGHVNKGEVVLSLLLGHIPTKDDLNNPAYKSILTQAENARQMSLAHLQNPKEGVYHFSGVPSSKMAANLASHFMEGAKPKEGTGYRLKGTGNCAHYLADSMSVVGLGKWRNHATPMAKSMLHSGEWVAINPDKTAPGDIVYRPHSFDRGGHIEGVVSVGPKGYLLASDFIHTLGDIRDNNHGRYKGLTVMRYVGPGGAKASDS